MTVRRTQSLKVIKEAFRIGFSVDKCAGKIFGRRGRELTLSKTGTQRYPCITLYLPTFKHIRKNPSFAIPAHKFMAYAIWGDRAFQEGVQIRHLNGVMDIREESLALGTGHENMMDIAPEVRQRAAKIARASQGKRPANAKLSQDDVKFIKSTVRRDNNGKVLRGELEKFAKRFGVSKPVISGILRGKTYDD